MGMSVLEELEGTTVEGIYCSACDFLMTIYGETSNREYLAMGRVHDRRYHSDNETSYDIRTAMKVNVFKPVTEIKLQIVCEPELVEPQIVKITTEKNK
jgi:hypothetical protein